MKRLRLSAFCLALCCLLCSCRFFSPAVPDAPTDGVDADGQEPSPAPDPLPLPAGDGVDWNDAPAQSVGEGGRPDSEPAMPSHSYSAYGYCSYDNFYTADKPDEHGVLLGTQSVSITGLRNQVLQNRLNELIEKRMQELASAEAPCSADELRALADGHGAASAYVNRFIYVNVQVSGRILSLRFVMSDSLSLRDANGDDAALDEWVQLGASQDWHMYDMHDGRRLRLRDLFFDGAEYAPVVDAAIAEALSEAEDSFSLKRAFRGLPEDYPYVDAQDGSLCIWFPADNPYIDGEYYFSIGPEALYPLCSVLYEDPSAYLTDEATVNFSAFSHPINVSAHPFEAAAAAQTDGQSAPLYAPRLSGGASQSVMDAVNTALGDFEERYKTLDYLPPQITDAWDSWDFHSVDTNFYALGDLFCVQYVTSIFGADYSYSHDESLVFDLRTGRRLTAADLLVPSDGLSALLEQNGVTQPLEDLDFLLVDYGYGVILPAQSLFHDPVYIPPEHFNFALLESEETP